MTLAPSLGPGGPPVVVESSLILVCPGIPRGRDGLRTVYARSNAYVAGGGMSMSQGTGENYTIKKRLDMAAAASQTLGKTVAAECEHPRARCPIAVDGSQKAR